MSFLEHTQGRSALVVTESLVYGHAWERTREEVVPQWMLDAGSTWACDIDPAECDRIHALADKGTPVPSDELRAQLVKTAVEHPREYLYSRLSVRCTQPRDSSI